MPQGTIQAVAEKDRWSNDYGNYVGYNVTLDTGQFVINRKLRQDGSHKPLNVGEVLHYSLNGTDRHGNRKIKEEKPEYAGQSNGSGDQGVVGGNFALNAPNARQDSIERQVAAKCAAQVAAAQVAVGKLPTVAALVDEFHQAIRGYTVEVDPKVDTAAESLPAADASGLSSETDDGSDIPF